MARYQVILSTGQTVNVPSDAARTKYEEIAQFGMSAVLERVKRTRAFKAAKLADDSARVRVIVCPNGDEVTQF